jgi:hypothetical protein
MNESEKQHWYRVYRAQTNCIEYFSITTPIFVAGAFLGNNAFGKYAARTMGTLAIANAFFRYKYWQGYCEDATLRYKWFHRSTNVSIIALLITVASAAFLVYKDGRCVYQKYVNKKGNSKK